MVDTARWTGTYLHVLSALADAPDNFLDHLSHGSVLLEENALTSNWGTA
jgi:hypothetical protein